MADKTQAPALIHEGPVKGMVMIYDQRVDEQRYVMLEILPPVGAGLRHVTLALTPEHALRIGEKLAALAKPGGGNGA